MMLWAIIGCLATFIIILTVKFIVYKHTNCISLQESLNLVGLPVITLESEGHKLNFILDTGSNESHVSKEAFEKLCVEKRKTETQVYGAGGVALSVGKVDLEFTYKNATYLTTLIISPALDVTFKAIKDSEGASIHGILGNDFLIKYSYVIDFESLVAYSKRNKYKIFWEWFKI